MGSKHNCTRCPFRAKYDNKPESMLGRMWRWHANWCPGWKKFITSLPEDERKSIAVRYKMEKYM